MGRAGKIIVFLFVVITFVSCCLKEDEVVYSASLYLFNNTGYDIEICKNEECWAMFADNNYLFFISTKSSNVFEEVSLERYFEEHVDKLKDISVYAVIDGERKFLKKWTFLGRNGDGKQLYRLSDSEIRVRHEVDLGRTHIYFPYIFIINPDDVGL